VKYEGHATGAMSLELFDLKGRYIGSYEYQEAQQWNPPHLPNGIYFLRLMQKGNSLATARFINLK
ncbi:MAG TPA: T9SS type A sorting domain-containing protein, partial [Candidatus Cloacimonadota bacterium]|nr:T9SS type A sorting domain-containing protein [Candidatus Cloacimonadota bacterium]